MSENKVLETMKNINQQPPQEEGDQQAPENPEEISFNLFDDDNKPDVDAKNSEYIENRLKSKFAALSEKEKALDAKMKEWEDKLASIDKSGTTEEQVDYKALASEDPVKVMELLGLDYEKLTHELVAKNDPEAKRDKTINSLQEEIQTLKQQIEEKDKKTLDNQEEMKYNEYVDGLTKRLQQKDELSFINAMGKHQDVVDAVVEYVNSYGADEGLEAIEEKASKAVEKLLKDEYEEIKSKLEGKDVKVNSNTIKNADKAKVFRSQKNPQDMNHDERVKTAINMLEWEE